MKASERFLKHTEDYYGNKFTSAAHDWEIFLEIVCASEKQARAIESHIKRMKSKIYITNLKRYPEMVEKLLNKYENS